MPGIFPERVDEYKVLEQQYQSQLEDIEKVSRFSPLERSAWLIKSTDQPPVEFYRIFLSPKELLSTARELIAKLDTYGDTPAVDIAYALLIYAKNMTELEIDDIGGESSVQGVSNREAFKSSIVDSDSEEVPHQNLAAESRDRALAKAQIRLRSCEEHMEKLEDFIVPKTKLDRMNEFVNQAVTAILQDELKLNGLNMPDDLDQEIPDEE